MSNFIDIHNHILPKLDDGSKSLEQTMEMFRIAYGEGIRTIIATPHYREGYYTNSIQVLQEQVELLSQSIREQLPDMKLLLGTEIYFSHNIATLIREKKIPTMAGSKYVLVEFSVDADFVYIKNGLQQLRFEGVLPILAHVERYDCLLQDLEIVEELIGLGVCIQLNASSITGEMGRRSKQVAKKLLKNNWVHFVATDAHSDGRRAPLVKKAFEYISKKFGTSYAETLMHENPKKVIDNKYF